MAVAESCTGGLVSRRVTSVSGSSDYFERGLVV
jgi:nicotinamide mononucleotide (NMN) deamidase PncC